MKVAIVCCALFLPICTLADTVVPIDSVQNHVNIRNSPAAGADIVGQLRAGTSLPLLESADGWNQVRLTDGGTGFISADWTRIVTESGAVAEASDDAPVESPEEEAADSAQPVEHDGEANRDDTKAAESSSIETDDEPIIETPGDSVVAMANSKDASDDEIEQVAANTASSPGAAVGPPGPTGPAGPPGPQGPPGAGTVKGDVGYLVRFKEQTVGTTSQVYDNGKQIGIGTTEPKQRLEVNGNIQIHERNSGVAGLMITQSSGETGYIMHNRASSLTIGAGSVDRLTIDRDGNVGIGEARPIHPLQLASGAHVTAGGVWTNSSSRAAKENIEALSLDEALAALAALDPVHYSYKAERGESYVGFIAEDVPDLVATGNRQGVSAMDVVAVLTRVVQAQQQRIDALEAKLDAAD